MLLAKTRDRWLIRLYSQEHFKGPTWESERNQTEIKLLLSPPYDGESSVTAPWKDFKTARKQGNEPQDEKGDGVGANVLLVKNTQLAFHSYALHFRLHWLSFEREGVCQNSE